MGEDLTLGIATFAVSVLYSAVGQAGGAGYLAVMGFAGTPPEVMRPTALLLNVVVGTAATAWLYRAGLLDFRGLWPFLVGSIPLAIVGGMMPLPRSIYNPLVGIVLLASAASLISSRKILANSAAALAGNVASVGSLPAALPLWSAAVLIGGLSGAELGSRWLPTGALIRILVLLQIAGGLKLLVWP